MSNTRTVVRNSIGVKSKFSRFHVKQHVLQQGGYSLDAVAGLNIAKGANQLKSLVRGFGLFSNRLN